MPPLLDTFMELSFRNTFHHWHHILLAVFHAQKPWSLQCEPNFERATSNWAQNEVTKVWGVFIQVQQHTVSQWTHKQCPARYNIATMEEQNAGPRSFVFLTQPHVASPLFLHTSLVDRLFLSEQTSFWSFSTSSFDCSFMQLPTFCRRFLKYLCHKQTCHFLQALCLTLQTTLHTLH